jgi:hypothetical protein
MSGSESRDFGNRAFCRAGIALRAQPVRAFAGIADAVDRSGKIVGNEERAVRHDDHVGRAAPWSLALQPAGSERLIADRPVVFHAHQRHAIADLLAAIP